MKHDPFHRHGGGLARTVVVAVATLSILLVCFSIYQHSQLDATAPSVPRGPRLPDPSAAPPPELVSNPSGVQINGGAVIGKSRDVKISLYEREGRESKMELTVSDWSPKAGSDHEFVLRDPEIRMRTGEGNDLRVKALEGSLEARRKSGSGLEPQRGKLIGDVLIEFDRRSQKDKEKLPEEERNKPSESDLVRLRAAELEFDVEFGRLTIPGKVVLTARDAGLEAHDVEVQFNQQDDRIETLRIERGGRIELLSKSQPLSGANLSEGRGQQKRTLVDWMRETLQTRIDAQALAMQNQAGTASPKAKSPEPAKANEADPSVRVFRLSQPPKPRTALRYVGRFEGNVDARQQVGDVTQSRLEADWLEVLRELSLDEGKKAESTQQQGAAPAGAAAPAVAPDDRIVLTWNGKLIVSEALPGGEGEPPTKVTAGGKPARLSHPEGDALCSQFEYLPVTGDLKLLGEPNVPVVVRSAEQGTIVGESIAVHRKDQALEMTVNGAGRIWEGDPSQNKQGSANVEIAALGPANIEFENGLKATGGVRIKTTLDYTGSMTTREYRLIDSVKFGGRTTLRQDKTSLVADSIEVGIKVSESWRELRQEVNSVVGTGNVLLIQKDDRLSCDRIDIALGSDGDGRPAVQTATALGLVQAVQGDRVLQASEKLIVDFAPAESKSVDGGGVANQDVQSQQKPGGTLGMDLGGSTQARRLRAYGEVQIVDPSQAVDLNCEHLDCALAGGDIESAKLSGTTARPATVQMDTFGVTGNEITLDVATESADVPGQGRMTILSHKDLDGRKVDEPIPIVVTWNDNMKYRGRENRAVFTGTVHASSQATTTFDCETLLVEFEEAVAEPVSQPKRSKGIVESWGLQGPLGAVWPGLRKPGESRAMQKYTREPRYIEATGRAVAQTAELLPNSTALKSRARISGPKLSLHLRSELSKLLIEGPGDLLLEDFQAAGPASSPSQNEMRSDLFSNESDAGPSKTVIKWRDRMWYDFGIDQTLFEGAVQLTHLSGAELDKVFGVPQGGTTNSARGRRTFLDSDTLTVDFADAPRSARRQSEQRMGRISSDRLRRFRAAGRVALREEVDQFSLAADEVTYERPRQTLLINGVPNRKAQLIRQRPGKLPDQMAAERIYFNLETGKIEISGPHIRSGQ